MPVPTVDTLDTSLGALLATSGARAVRVVDGRTGRVVGAAGESAPAGRADDSAAVAQLLADQAHLPVDAGDVLVTTDRYVHLLRSTPVTGVFVHLRLDLDRADTGRAHRALADPRLHAAVRSALGPASSAVAVRPPGSAADAPSPRPRPRPAGLSVPAARQPALAALAVGSAAQARGLPGGRSGHGLRAAGVLTELMEVGHAAGTLPRRRRSAVQARPAAPDAYALVVTAGLPERTWARDVDTMRRLLAGLRRLK